MDKKYAKYLMDKTSQDYSLIAGSFSSKRRTLWPDLLFLKKFCRDKEKILDLGCGNGRLIELFKDFELEEYVGVDDSKELIDIAKTRQNIEHRTKNIKFLRANALDLPFKDKSFDKIFSISVFHHIPSIDMRIKFLKEVRRVLKEQGLLILSVWNLGQKTFLKYHIKYFFLKICGKSKLDFLDIFYPWKNQEGKTLIQRYLHFFTKTELKNLMEISGFKVLEIGFCDTQKRNIYLVASPYSLMDKAQPSEG